VPNKPPTAKAILRRNTSPAVAAAASAAKALLNDIRTGDAEEVVRNRLFEGTPHIFKADPTRYDTLRKHLADSLEVDQSGLRVVGSAMTGFSMSPNSFGRQFLPSSDVDMIVVSDKLFDFAWNLLLRWRYPWHIRKWDRPDHGWAIGLLENFIAGWCYPTTIEPPALMHRDNATPIRDFSWKWVDAFLSVGGTHPELAGRNFSGRLYRTWDFATKYHVNGFGLVPGQNAAPEGGI
jgi:hypothetical protein